MPNIGLSECLRIAAKLEKHQQIIGLRRSNDENKYNVCVKDGLIYVDGFKPMTWDTFTHLWLLNIEQEDITHEKHYFRV